jgi:hypothetical protein
VTYTDVINFNTREKYSAEIRRKLLEEEYNRCENIINQEDENLSNLLNSAKKRAQVVLRDPPNIDP